MTMIFIFYEEIEWDNREICVKHEKKELWFHHFEMLMAQILESTAYTIGRGAVIPYF